MKKIGIIANLTKELAAERTAEIIRTMRERCLEPLVMQPVYNLLGQGTLVGDEEFFQKSDIIIVMGGDGTLLRAGRQAAVYDKPILGINLGRLGFLTEAELPDAYSLLDAIASGKYKIEKRMMLKASVKRDGRTIVEYNAINDVAVAKGSFARIIHLKAYINGEFVNNYPSDGLLVSSPTGSTAYSLSAGGPIIYPGMSCLLLTPICPHTLNVRPIVTDAKSEIQIVVNDPSKDILLTIDGQEGTTLSAGDIVTVTEADQVVRLVRVNPRGFFNLLKEKLTEWQTDEREGDLIYETGQTL